MVIKTEHIGVAIFKLLRTRNEIEQKELVRILEDMGYKKHKVLLYLRFILAIPLPVKEDKWSIPMIKRDIFDKTSGITIKLNPEWRNTNEKSVIMLFDKCNPDKY